jgi:hypothetical protein
MATLRIEDMTGSALGRPARNPVFSLLSASSSLANLSPLRAPSGMENRAVSKNDA